MKLTASIILCCFVLGCADRGDEDSGAGEGSSAPWLVEVTGASGIDFRHHCGAHGDLILTEIMGGGAALFDCDGDGDLDAFLVDGAADAARPDASRADTPNRLYRNDGEGHFADVTAGAGLEVPSGVGMGVAVGDVDGDGRDDLYVTQYGPDRLYRNLGDGRFEDVTEAWRLDVPAWSCSAAFFDADADGDLDLFVTQYIELDLGLECRDGAGRRTYCPPLSGAPLADVFLRNDGDRFTDASVSSGIASASAAGLGVVCEDFDGDGRTDVFVANDGYENHLWIAAEGGEFVEEATLRGVAFNHLGAPEAGMGVLAEDLDGDGLTDLLLTHLQEETNTLYRGRGAGGVFVDDTGSSGLFETTMAFTGFGIAALDLELDGDLDVVIANGRVRAGIVHPASALGAPFDVLAEPNLLLVNDGEGRFQARGALAPAFTGPAEVNRGIATGDIDGDGDLDMLVTQIDGPARVYRNDAPRAGPYLLVDARSAGTRAIGTRVALESGATRVVRTVRATDGYLTSRDPRAHFALPRGASADGTSLLVTWPDGARERFAVASLDTVLTVVRGTGEEL